MEDEATISKSSPTELTKVAKDDQTTRKSRDLRAATSHLREEALRRYRERHKLSLDRHEQAVIERFAQERAFQTPHRLAPTPEDDSLEREKLVLTSGHSGNVAAPTGKSTPSSSRALAAVSHCSSPPRSAYQCPDEFKLDRDYENVQSQSSVESGSTRYRDVEAITHGRQVSAHDDSCRGSTSGRQPSSLKSTSMSSQSSQEDGHFGFAEKFERSVNDLLLSRNSQHSKVTQHDDYGQQEGLFSTGNEQEDENLPAGRKQSLETHEVFPKGEDGIRISSAVGRSSKSGSTEDEIRITERNFQEDTEDLKKVNRDLRGKGIVNKENVIKNSAENLEGDEREGLKMENKNLESEDKILESEDKILESEDKNLEREDNDLERAVNALEREDNALEREDNDLEREDNDLERAANDREREESEDKKRGFSLEREDTNLKSEDQNLGRKDKNLERIYALEREDSDLIKEEREGNDLEKDDNDLERDDNDLERDDNDLERDDNDLEKEDNDLEREDDEEMQKGTGDERPSNSGTSGEEKLDRSATTEVGQVGGASTPRKRDAVDDEQQKEELEKDNTSKEARSKDTEESIKDQENLEEKRFSHTSRPSSRSSRAKRDDSRRNSAYEEAQEELEEMIEEASGQIAEDFSYDLKKLQSGPVVVTKESKLRATDDEDEESATELNPSLPSNLLQLHHSLGYDCKKRHNLAVIDEDTLMFSAGNLVQLLKVPTGEQTHLRSLSGGGIGCLAVHPSREYFAVGEKGKDPNINIYKYPSLCLVRVLKGGTETGYSFIDFSPDGRLLAAVGSHPDYMLTLWDWKQENVMLRSKAFSQDIYRISFSSDLQGYLTSSGAGHIRFWKMASTFTGLKLQGELGKFGKTEISDIEGYVELPDGKVLSGSENGNLLLWDGALIKTEISLQGRTCHEGQISQIIMDEGEIITVGSDGYVKVWDFDTIDSADATDESGIFEMEVMNELKIGEGVDLRTLVKSVNPSHQNIWYAQDASGAIWKLDLSFTFTSAPPEKTMSYHAGQIQGCDTSPMTHLVATTGMDNSVRVYDYVSKRTISESFFNAAGTSLLWPSQQVDSSCWTIIAGFGDGILRVLNLSHTSNKSQACELTLKLLTRPHDKAITALVTDEDGKILATGSEDQTVFFLNIEKNYEPIGFISTPAPVRNLQWAPRSFGGKKLLIGCISGEILEVDVSLDSALDNVKSYQLELPTKYVAFKSIRSTLEHEEELEIKEKEAEEKRLQDEEERQRRLEAGEEMVKIDADELIEEEQQQEEEFWEPYVPSEPSPLLFAMYGRNENAFWISMGGYDGGYFYQYRFGENSIPSNRSQESSESIRPLKAIRLQNSHGMSIPVIKLDSSKNRILLGLQDGSIRIHLAENGELDNLGDYWTVNMHDNDYGRITHLQMSYDGRFLLSCGADGNFFAYKMLDLGSIDHEVEASLPSAREVEKIADIEDSTAYYSIENAKQRAEYDKKVREADQKKKDVRRIIQGLQDKFKEALERNSGLPSEQQVESKNFEMDSAILRDIERNQKLRRDGLQKELSWEEARKNLALQKLKGRYKDIIQCELTVLYSFDEKTSVSSIQSYNLPKDFEKVQCLEKEEETETESEEILNSNTEIDKTKEEDKVGTDFKTTLKGNQGQRIVKALRKVEEKRRKREQRLAQWEAFMASKPPQDYKDPADVIAINNARLTIGDYKLKCAPDYQISEKERMNINKGRQSLLQIKKQMINCKQRFNQQFMELRQEKFCTIDKIKLLTVELQEVQERLAEGDRMPIPRVLEVRPEEVPEKKYEITREALDEWRIKKFGYVPTAQRVKRRKLSHIGGSLDSQTYEFPSSTSGTASTGRPQNKTEWTQVSSSTKVESETEKRLKGIERIRNLYKQSCILKKINDCKAFFDAQLRCLRHERFCLDVDLKSADLRELTLYEELLLLKKFEKKENELLVNLQIKEKEKSEIENKILDLQMKLDTKRKDIEKLAEDDRELTQKFMHSLGGNNTFAEFLTKVFKKRIKRVKRRDNDDDEDEEDPSDFEDDWSDSEFDSDSESGGAQNDSEMGGPLKYDLDVCPADCEQTLYERTCSLREDRLDIEEKIAEGKKMRDALVKDLDAFRKKNKIVSSGLDTASSELEAFQLEKQSNLNDLDVVVTLRLDQIQFAANAHVPADLSPCLVFPKQELERLEDRIDQLEKQKESIKKKQQEAQHNFAHLRREEKANDCKIEEMKKKCKQMMLEKFGKEVDLEVLETVIIDRDTEEMKEKVREKEKQHDMEVKEMKSKIDTLQRRMVELIKENTECLEQMNMLFTEKNIYAEELDAKQKNLGTDYAGANLPDLQEQKRLSQLVKLQKQEIESLKEEIMALSRKGGQVLPPLGPAMTMSTQTSAY